MRTVTVDCCCCDQEIFMQDRMFPLMPHLPASKFTCEDCRKKIMSGETVPKSSKPAKKHNFLWGVTGIIASREHFEEELQDLALNTFLDWGLEDTILPKDIVSHLMFCWDFDDYDEPFGIDFSNHIETDKALNQAREAVEGGVHLYNDLTSLGGELDRRVFNEHICENLVPLRWDIVQEKRNRNKQLA